MTNAELFRRTFNGLYATEMWAKSEQEFLDWLNLEAETNPEPRVLSLEEILHRLKEPVFLETKSRQSYTGWVLVYDVQKGMGITGERMGLTQPGHITTWYPIDLYGSKWRCWSARPTEQQMKRRSGMNDLLELKESLIKHLHIENSRTNLNFDECFACAYRPDGKDTCDNLIPLIDGALSMIIKLEPHVIGLSEIEEGEGYWMTTMSSDFKPLPVICVHNEKDARKPYITFAWQYGTFSWEAETYGTEWRLWSAKPIGHLW